MIGRPYNIGIWIEWYFPIFDYQIQNSRKFINIYYFNDIFVANKLLDWIWTLNLVDSVGFASFSRKFVWGV